MPLTLKDLLEISGMLVLIAIAYGVLKTKVDQLKDRCDKTDKENESLRSALGLQGVDIARAQEWRGSVTDDLRELKDKMDRLADESMKQIKDALNSLSTEIKRGRR